MKSEAHQGAHKAARCSIHAFSSSEEPESGTKSVPVMDIMTGWLRPAAVENNEAKTTIDEIVRHKGKTRQIQTIQKEIVDED